MKYTFENNRISELRQEKMLSQHQLAKELKTSQANISRWEQNIIAPSIIECWRIADYFGVSIDYLCGRTED